MLPREDNDTLVAMHKVATSRNGKLVIKYLKQVRDSITKKFAYELETNQKFQLSGGWIVLDEFVNKLEKARETIEARKIV